VDQRPGEPDHGGRPPGDDAWVPPEPAGAVRPAWLPPGVRPGEPYGTPHGQVYGQPDGRAYGQADGRAYGQAHGPYAGSPPYGSPYGGPPPYGSGPGHGKPRMPRWAKVVLVLGVGFYLVSAVAGLVDLMLLDR
jgi:hypothetical protein